MRERERERRSRSQEKRPARPGSARTCDVPMYRCTDVPVDGMKCRDCGCAFAAFVAQPLCEFPLNDSPCSFHPPPPSSTSSSSPLPHHLRLTSLVLCVAVCIGHSSHSLMRRSSVSLPTRIVAHDPHEKAARYSTRGANSSAIGTLEKRKTAGMTQSQRSRFLKTGGVLLFVIFLFYYLSPNGTDVYTGGTDYSNCGETPLIILSSHQPG